MRAEPPLPEPFVTAVADVVRRRTGLVFSVARRVSLEAGLRLVFPAAERVNADACASRLEDDPACLDALVAAITVGETYFFRESAQFDFIRTRVFPEVLARTDARHPLRVWSAGCAAGEEAYTLAIVLRELGLHARARVLGTDISRSALAAARRAEYSAWSLRGVSDEVINRYFSRAGSRYRLQQAIARSVELHYLNLAEDVYPAVSSGVWGMDLVLCRNVLIYFDRETVARVARRLLDTLSPHGWLICGASDPPLHELVPCDAVMTPGGLAYRRVAGAANMATPLAIEQNAPGEVPAVVGRGPSTTTPPEPPARTPEIVAADERRATATSAVSAAPPVAIDADAMTAAYTRRDYPRAAELARALVGSERGDEPAWVVLVRALANLGDVEEAGRACALALDRCRQSAELTYLHAVLLSEAGRHREAADAARGALYLDRDLVVAHLACGTALSRSGDVMGARRSFDNARRLLEAMAPDAIVPASDGEPAVRLAAIVRLELTLLGGVAA